MSKQVSHLYEFGPFRLDARERLLLREGEAVPLTPKAFETLLLLVESAGHTLEKDELMSRLWPDIFVEEANLTNNISLLRKALEESPNGHEYIKTVPRRGYRFIGAVKTTVAGGAAAPASELRRTSSLPTTSTSSASAEHIISEIKNHKKSVMLFLAALIIGVAAVVYLFPGSKPIDSVAVLPFVNVSADPNTEYLSDGISESLINTLRGFRSCGLSHALSRFDTRAETVIRKPSGVNLAFERC